MTPTVYCPMEEPPTRRLYIIREGRCRFRRRTLAAGESWGAEDVMLQSAVITQHRALAESYLHVLSISAAEFSQIGREHKEAYLLV